MHQVVVFYYHKKLNCQKYVIVICWTDGLSYLLLNMKCH